jgi:hypothetical protein
MYIQVKMRPLQFMKMRIQIIITKKVALAIFQ